MCLAVPMRVLEKRDERGVVEIGGVRKEIMLTLTPEAKAGDFVVVHAGYALAVVDKDEAQITMQLLREIGRGFAS